jgi:hypothetical protein
MPWIVGLFPLAPALEVGMGALPSGDESSTIFWSSVIRKWALCFGLACESSSRLLTQLVPQASITAVSQKTGNSIRLRQ